MFGLRAQFRFRLACRKSTHGRTMADLIGRTRHQPGQVIAEPLEAERASEGVKELDDRADKAIVLVLEPIDADKRGYKFLNDVAVAIAKACGGAVLEGPMGLVKLDQKDNEAR
nr:putative integron gene cassette protein [uncultured bacterium]